MMDFFKIAIVNNSGNVGKSLVCDTLLKPRLSSDVEIIKIETINADVNLDGSVDEVIAAKNFLKVFDKIDSCDKAIIDVGSSNIEIFMDNLKKLEGSHEDIDFFFVPTTPNVKQQLDTITTVNDLLNLGVNENQIKIIFNYYDSESTIEHSYTTFFESELFDLLKLNKIENIYTINESPVFDMASEMGTSFLDIANDKRDFKALLRGTTDKQERSTLSKERAVFRLSQGLIKELDLTFERLNNACKLV
jgi:hypothetical protein